MLILLVPTQTLAKAPECPLYNTKQECLLSVESNHDEFLRFIENADEEDKARLLDASLDIKKYESLACQKTCLN
ncbi:MAG: hypothetical protein H0X26_03835 [Alphaproteobacteria bacterium]|nr:hypothetical protein [Alphaproteobacteria bacterium]